MQAVEEGQHPLAAVLGCADSRVPVELLFDGGFGDLFVVRNGGTMSTTAAIASLEYAVGQLRMELLQYGDQQSLEESCRRHTLSAAGNLVHSSVLLTDRLRAKQLTVVAGYYDLHRCSIEWMGEVEPIQYRSALAADG